nr:endogenous retrovirus group K member 7 Gag polyprotein-like [Columba livia]
MGQATSQEHKLHLQVLLQVLRSSGYRISEKQVASLLVWVKENCAWFPSEGTFDSKIWKQVGEHLHAQKNSGFAVPDSLHITWRFVYSALSQLQSAEHILQGQTGEDDQKNTNEQVANNSNLDSTDSTNPFESGSVGLEKESVLYPSLMPSQPCKDKAGICEELGQKSKTLPSAPTLPDFNDAYTAPSNPFMTKTAEHKGVMQKCREKAMEHSNFSFTFPVIYKPQQPPEHDAIPYTMVKELKKSVQENGLHSPFTMGIVEDIGATYVMTPWDWKLLAKTILTPTEYAVWQLEYCHLAIEQVLENVSSGAGINQDMLLGTGQYITPQAQAGLPWQVFVQTTRIAITAWRRIPEAGQRVSSFATLRQGPQESYISFVDRLQTAIARQVENEDVAKVMLLQLAYDNANCDCQAALLSVKGKATDIAQYVKACQNIGTETFQALVLASALSQLSVNQGSLKCFICGNEGHVSKNCPLKRYKTPRECSPRWCPRCQKGYPWSNSCKSQFHRSGKPLLGNGKRGAKPGALQSNRVQNPTSQLQNNLSPGAATVSQSGAQSVISPLQSQAVPGWLWQPQQNC